MSILFKEKYKNNIRVISGTGSLIYKDDCILLCDTSLSGVTINLLNIPQNYFNYLQKITIIDISNNAQTNNIVINAGTGQTINGTSSITLNTNGVIAEISIINNNSFGLKQFATTGSGGSGYNQIQDESTNLPQRQIIDFVGGYVTATDTGSKTLVTVNPSIIALTFSQLNNLIISNQIIAGQHYLVTDAINTDLGIILIGINQNQVTNHGWSLHLNADYQGVGNYSSVSGFIGTVGIWANDMPPVNIGNVAIWNNNHYVNLTGLIGTAPSSDFANWQILPKSITNGFIFEVCFSTYDINTNSVIYRIDTRNNEVRLPRVSESFLVYFPFGNNNFLDNKVYSVNIILNLCNSHCVYTNNIFINTQIDDSTSRLNSGLVKYNYFKNSTITFNNIKGTITNNNINESTVTINGIFFPSNIFSNNNINTDSSVILSGNVDGLNFINNFLSSKSKVEFLTTNGNVQIQNCTLSSSAIIQLDSCNGVLIRSCHISNKAVRYWSRTIVVEQNKTANSGYSDFSFVLDMNNSSIFDLTTNTLNIPVDLSHCGIFYLSNGIGKEIERISNFDVSIMTHKITLTPNNQTLPNNITIIRTPVSSYIPNQIIGDEFTNTGVNIFNARTNGGSDYCVLIFNSDVFHLIHKHIWQ
ncbi:MAG: hypothetical protein QXM96_00250 [Candidatus Woesearchaeota archaeon]